jgi:hypothetical protein
MWFMIFSLKMAVWTLLSNQHASVECWTHDVRRWLNCFPWLTSFGNGKGPSALCLLSVVSDSESPLIQPSSPPPSLAARSAWCPQTAHDRGNTPVTSRRSSAAPKPPMVIDTPTPLTAPTPTLTPLTATITVAGGLAHRQRQAGPHVQRSVYCSLNYNHCSLNLLKQYPL